MRDGSRQPRAGRERGLGQPVAQRPRAAGFLFTGPRSSDELREADAGIPNKRLSKLPRRGRACAAPWIEAAFSHLHSVMIGEIGALQLSHH